ncbi:MAG TPA: hypothetical protein ENH39_04120 [Gammaproteobacteria bacterium]|nr:hypothetical protein [Gammaproteobacteria bacterium]
MIGEGDVIFAVDQKTGKTVWEQDKLTNRGLTPPAVMGSYILIGDKSGYLHVLEASTGEIVGRAKVGSELLAQPVTRGLSAWIQTVDGDVYAWKLTE